MAANRLTQAALLALTENTSAKAVLTQVELLALTENTGANAVLTQAALLVLTDPPGPGVTRSVTVDARLLLHRSDTVSVGAVLRATGGRSVTVSATLLGQPTRTVSVSAVLARTARFLFPQIIG